jgi:hypothetical protein
MTNARDKANIPVLNFQSKGIDDNATSTAVTILSDGKIGIGTVNPVRELHVDGSTSSIAIGKNGSGSATLRFYSDGSQKSYIQLDPSENMVYYAPSGTDQQFYAGGSERMRLTSTGLGIGSSAPSAGLEVSNSSGIKISRSGYSQYMQLYPANNNVPTILGLGGNGIHIGTTTSTGIHVDGSDNVLINTTSASGFDSAGLPLIVGSGSTHQGITIFSGTSHQGAIHFADGTGTSSYRGQLNYKHDADAMTFAVTGSEKMRLNSTGLGIGSSAPSRPLHIVSSDNQLARFESTDTYGGIELCDNASGTAKPLISAVANDFVFYRGGSSHTVAFGATSVGFGVATASPSSELEVYGASTPKITVKSGNGTSASIKLQRVNENDASTDFELKNDGGELKIIADNSSQNEFETLRLSSTEHKYFTNNSERMRLTSTGLGIGTTSVGSPLTVSGGTNSTVANINNNVSSTTDASNILLLQSNTSGSAGVGHGLSIAFNGERNDGNTQRFGNLSWEARTNSGTSLATDFFLTHYDGTQTFRVKQNGRIVRHLQATASGHGNFVGEVGASFKALAFEHTVGGGIFGHVTTNGGGSVSYNTTSDYRLKENVSYDFDATSRLKQLKPARFNFIADADTTVDGFLAHEVSSSSSRSNYWN